MSAVMRLDLMFFAFRASDLRRGFRRAANEVDRDGVGHGRARTSLVNTFAPLALMNNVDGCDLDMHSALWDGSNGEATWALSLVRAQLLYSTTDDLVRLLRGNPGGSYLDLEPDDRLPARCSGEFRAKSGSYGTGEWESRWVQ